MDNGLKPVNRFGYPVPGIVMRVSKWGNSLAVRLPADVARRLGIKKGDKLDIAITGERTAEVKRRLTREDALERIQSAQWKLPDGYKFDREELYENRGPL
jgi:antitoxin MazE